MDGLMDRCMSTQIDRPSAENQGRGSMRCVEVWCIASSLYSSRCSHWGNVITYITVMPTCSARDGTDYSQMSLYRPTDQLSESRQTHLHCEKSFSYLDFCLVFSQNINKFSRRKDFPTPFWHKTYILHLSGYYIVHIGMPEMLYFIALYSTFSNTFLNILKQLSFSDR